MKQKTIVIVALLLLICVSFYTISFKPSITNATAIELQNISGIGEVISLRIVFYYNTHPDHGVNEAIRVKGIGEKLLSKLKRRYK